MNTLATYANDMEAAQARNDAAQAAKRNAWAKACNAWHLANATGAERDIAAAKAIEQPACGIADAEAAASARAYDFARLVYAVASSLPDMLAGDQWQAVVAGLHEVFDTLD